MFGQLIEGLKAANEQYEAYLKVKIMKNPFFIFPEKNHSPAQ